MRAQSSSGPQPKGRCLRVIRVHLGHSNQLLDGILEADQFGQGYS